jgi:hypothetical protein
MLVVLYHRYLCSKDWYTFLGRRHACLA